MKSLLTKRALVLILLFLFAFFIRFAFINKGPFHYDTLDLALTAQKTLVSHSLQYEHGSGYPLTVIAGAFFIFIFKLFGVTDPVFCVNFMSVFFGAFGVLILFLLVEKLFDKQDGRIGFHTAMFSAIFLACFAPHIAISTFGKSLTLSIALSLLSAYYMERYAQEDKNMYLVFSSIFLGFCAAARLSDALVVFPVSYLYFSAGKMTYAKIRVFVVFGFIALMTALIYYLPMFFDKGFSQFASVWGARTQTQFLGIFSYAFRAALRWFLDIFMFQGVIIFLAGLWLLIQKKRSREFFFLMIWFFLLQFFYGNVSSIGVRYLVVAWIPLLIAQGFFLGSFKGKFFYLSAFFVLVSALVSFLQYAPVLEFRHRYALQVEFAQWVSKQVKPDSFVMAIDESIFLKYYGRPRVLGVPVTCDQKVIDAFFNNAVDKLLQRRRRVYIVSSAFPYAYDPCGMFKRGFLKRYEMVFVGEKINEDWHHSLLDQNLFTEGLYELKKKSLFNPSTRIPRAMPVDE